MEAYVVRIYRRSGTQPDSVVGILEDAATGTTRRFGSLAELAALLTTPGGAPDEAEDLFDRRQSDDAMAQ